MLRKIKYFTVVISLLSFFLISGCRNASQIQETIEVKNETQEAKPFVIPQYEVIETPRYKRLKQTIENTKNEINLLKGERDFLLTKYTEQYVPVKKISSDLEALKKRLAQLESSLSDETEKLEKRPKNPAV